MKLFNLIFNIPFPDTCIVCGKPVEHERYVCEGCADKIEYMSTIYRCRTCLGLLQTAQNGMCGCCIKENARYSKLISCVKYSGDITATMRAYKFRNRPDYHIGFSKLACEVLTGNEVYFDAVVPVPVSRKTIKYRGYNQSALIAKKIAEHFGVAYFDDLLIKIKETKSQSSLKLNQRKENVSGAFDIIRPERIYGCTILLVDDIFTTGYTMREAAKMCAPFADDIIAFTIARGTLEK